MYKDITGLLWIMSEIGKENSHPIANALASPKYRAYQKLLWKKSVTLEEAKQALKDEEDNQEIYMATHY
jgi:hypothetical protein